MSIKLLAAQSFLSSIRDSLWSRNTAAVNLKGWSRLKKPTMKKIEGLPVPLFILELQKW